MSTGVCATHLSILSGQKHRYNLIIGTLNTGYLLLRWSHPGRSFWDFVASSTDVVHIPIEPVFNAICCPQPDSPDIADSLTRTRPELVNLIFAISGAKFDLAKVCEVVIMSTFGLVQQV